MRHWVYWSAAPRLPPEVETRFGSILISRLKLMVTSGEGGAEASVTSRRRSSEYAGDVLYDLLYKTVLTRTDPELIHDACIKAIEVTSRIPLARDAVRQMWGRRPILPVPSANQGGPFARPVPGLLGLAAGMDKEGRAVEGMDMLGFGFVEIGTFTARAQDGNDRPRMWRHPRTRAIRNRMGFNNPGADEAARRLRALRATARGRSIVVGANIGKTKATALVDAVEDYRYSAGVVARWADYLVVNVSSPNTPGLRTLQNVDALRPILEAVREAGDAAARRHVPLLVKIAPDLADEDIDAVADLVDWTASSPPTPRSTTAWARAVCPALRCCRAPWRSCAACAPDWGRVPPLSGWAASPPSWTLSSCSMRARICSRPTPPSSTTARPGPVASTGPWPRHVGDHDGWPSAGL